MLFVDAIDLAMKFFPFGQTYLCLLTITAAKPPQWISIQVSVSIGQRRPGFVTEKYTIKVYLFLGLATLDLSQQAIYLKGFFCSLILVPVDQTLLWSPLCFALCACLFFVWYFFGLFVQTRMALNTEKDNNNVFIDWKDEPISIPVDDRKNESKSRAFIAC